MVLGFKNEITLLGGSQEHRAQCFRDIDSMFLNTMEGTLVHYENSSVVTIVTTRHPFDNQLLEIATKYLALDFINTATPLSDILLKDWQLCIKIRDQEVRFSDNYDYKEGCDLGSIYQVNLDGGFPGCLSTNEET